MSVLKRLFSRNKKYKIYKRAIEAGRLASILERQDIDLFLDVGANTGQTVDEIRRGGYRGEIISFEPIAQCHDDLVARSASDPAWTVAPRCALGEREGMVDLLVAEGSSLSSLGTPTAQMADAFPKARTASTESVPIHRLDKMMADRVKAAQRPFLKIDAQGHDMEVLRGAEGVMPQLAGVKIEMSLFPLYEGETLFMDVLGYLHDHDFRPHMLTDVGFSKTLGRQLQIDGVFIRE